MTEVINTNTSCNSTAIISTSSNNNNNNNSSTNVIGTSISINIPAINQLAEELAKAVKNRKRSVRSAAASASTTPTEKKLKQSKENEAAAAKRNNFQYSLVKRIDDGAFSYVYLTDTNEACKIIPLKYQGDTTTQFEKRVLQVKNETRIHQRLSHPYIVDFHRVIEGKQNMYILMEFCAGGTLNDKWKRFGAFTEPMTSVYLHQIIQAFKYLHQERKIVHRDLKLANVFLSEDEKQIKLGDFGLAIDGIQCNKRDTCGTPNYLAPEIVAQTGEYSFAVDIWAFGVLMFMMLCGRAPFAAKTLTDTYRKIKEAKVVFKPSEEARLSEDSVHLMKMILQLKSVDRPSWEQIEQHAFFTAHSSNI